MGSPSARLNVRESLRPWVESGVTHVFNPGGSISAALAQQTAQSAPAQQTQQNRSTQNQASQQQAPQQQAAPSSNNFSNQQGPAPAQSRPEQTQPSQGQPQQATQQQQQAKPNLPNFPAPWSNFLRFAKPEPKVIWTYMELGLDLGGKADPRRSNVLKNLQAHLRWPAGTINFWPVAALSNDALQPSTSCFWEGWQIWRTPYIACFGREALKVMLPDSDPNATTHMLEDVTVFVLPPISELVTMLPHEQQLSVDSLTSIRF